jgi:hypothetical protein
MKTFDLNTGNKLNNESSMNHFFKEALTIEELFSVRGGNSDNSGSSEDDEKKNGSDDDQQEDALL